MVVVIFVERCRYGRWQKQLMAKALEQFQRWYPDVQFNVEPSFCTRVEWRVDGQVCDIVEGRILNRVRTILGVFNG